MTITTKNNTAVLFFSRTAQEEAVQKTFSPQNGRKGNIKISQSLIDHVVNIIESSGLPVITHYSNVQRGNSFGERLANAIESVYAYGYEKVIVVGNDCPFVTADILLSINKSLIDQPLVLGPTTDGGVYTIGIKKDTYDREEFLNLPWQKDVLQNGFKEYADHKGISIEWLEEYFDIDEALDFQQLLQVLPNNNSLRIQLLNILVIEQTVINFITFDLIGKLHFNKLPLRGPPSFH